MFGSRWSVARKVFVWNVGNFRREHFMAEVARASCGDNPGMIQDLDCNNHNKWHVNGDNYVMIIK